jgi:TonB family protein
VRETLNLLTPEPRSRTTIYVAVSLFLHAILLLYWYLHRPDQVAVIPTRPRFVEIISTPTFTEAPGKKLEEPAPKTAAFSDANRRAASPHATGTQRTLRPGDEGAITEINPPSGQRQASRPAPTQPQSQQPQQASMTPPNQNSSLPPLRAAAASTAVDWKGAIRQLANGANLGSGDEEGRPSRIGGENGFAEDGPISFESQWYDWGEYAEGMVRRIRSNWYANMPELIKVGMKGVVTLQFTIERSGRVSNVTIVSSSGIPPYDNAAKKAIEISSPLAALPADFPNPRERVTAQFYYNMKPPER